jgi:elongation factor Ts
MMSRITQTMNLLRNEFIQSSLRRFSCTVSIALISQLRKDTGSSIQKCKEALEKCGNDATAAIQFLRKRGEAINATQLGKLGSASSERISVFSSEDKRSCIVAKTAAQTDFAAESELFVRFSEALTTAMAVREVPADVMDTIVFSSKFSPQIHSSLLKDIISELSGILSEPIAIKSIERVEGDIVSVYLHNKSLYSKNVGAKGAVVSLKLRHEDEAAREKLIIFSDLLARQVLATKPTYLSEDSIPPSVIQKERDILASRVGDSSKMEKAFSGHMKRFVTENCLLKMGWIIPFPGLETEGETVGEVLRQYCVSAHVDPDAIEVARFVLV